MNRIVDALVRRITGGKGIRVRAFGGQLTIETTPTPARKKDEGTPSRIGEILYDNGDGSFIVDTYELGFDEDPTDQVDAYPIEGSGFAEGTRVILVWVKGVDEGAGRWYFDKSTSVSTKPGTVMSGIGEGPYSILTFNDGFDEAHTGVVTAYAMQCAATKAFPSGLRVQLFHVPTAEDGDGRWYFQGPIWVDR